MTSSAPTCEDRSRSLLRDSVGTTLTNGALTIVGILNWIALARLLDPTWRGALALIMIAPATVMKLGTFGFDQGIVVMGGSDRKQLGPLTRTGVVFGFLMGLLAVGVFIGFMWGFPATFWKITQVWLPELFMVVSLAFPLHLMTMAYDAAVYADDRIGARNVKDLVVNIVMLAIVLTAVLHYHYQLFGVVGAYIVANTISLGYGWFLVRGKVDLLGGLRVDLFSRAVKLGFPMYVAQLTTFLMLPAMMGILSWQLPGDARENLARIAFFVMGYQIVDRVLQVTRSIGFALLPKITGGTEQAAGELAGKASRHTLMVALVIFGLLLALMHPIVVVLLGRRYLPVVGAFAVMAPGGLALSVAGVWSTHLLARCKPYYVARAGLVGVIVALIMAGLGFRFVPTGREVLVASASVVIGTLVNAGVLLPAFCRTAGISVAQALLPTGDDLREWRRIPGFVSELMRRRRPYIEGNGTA